MGCFGKYPIIIPFWPKFDLWPTCNRSKNNNKHINVPHVHQGTCSEYFMFMLLYTTEAGQNWCAKSENYDFTKIYFDFSFAVCLTGCKRA